MQNAIKDKSAVKVGYPARLPYSSICTIWICVSVVVAISVMSLAGWLFGNDWLKAFNLYGAPMTVISAICFLFTSAALIIIFLKRSSTINYAISNLLSIFLVLIGLLTIYSWFHVKLTGEEASITEIPFLNLILSPGGRMALLSAMIFLFTGLVLILLTIKSNTGSNVAHALFFPAVIASYMVPVSYILNVFSVHQFLSTAVSLNSGISFCTISIAIYMIRPDSWFMKVFTGRETGGIMARRLFPWILVIPIILGWLRIYGEHAGIFISEVGVLLIAITYTFCFIFLVWITARSVNLLDLRRMKADEALKRSYEELETRVNERTFELLNLNSVLDIEITERKRAESDLVKLNAALENIVERRTSELLVANERLEILSGTSSILLAAGNPLELINPLCMRVMKFLDCQIFFNFLVNDTIGKLNLNAYSGISADTARDIEWIGYNSTVCGKVARDGIRMVAENIAGTPGPWTDLLSSFGIQAYACHPLLAHDKVLGTLSFGTNSRSCFSEDDLTMMKTFTDLVAVAIARVRDEDTIHRSEERYRCLMELSPGASFVNRDNRIVMLNTAARKLIGVSSVDELIGKTALGLFHPDCHKILSERIEKLLNGENIPMTEERIIRHDGTIRDVEVVAARIMDSEGPAIQMIMSDITDRKLAERELLETKSYLENLISNANVPIVVWDKSNKIRLFNHAFEELTGYSSSEVTGKIIGLLFPTDSLTESLTKIKDALTQDLKTIEIPILTRKGEIRTVLWNSTMIFNNSGTSYSIIAMGNDITERNRAEQAFKKSKEKLDIALENGRIGIWEWDIIKEILNYDERMERMFGMDPGSDENTVEAFVKSIHEDDLAHLRETVQLALTDKKPFETIFRVKHKGAENNYLSTKALVTTDNNGNPVMISGVCFDITEMQRGAERALFLLNEELLRSNKELEQFAYVASHDLQEPLRMVLSFTRLLSQRYKQNFEKEEQEFMQYIIDGASHMQILIRDLLDYSRIETRAREFKLVDMNDILAQAIVNLSYIIREKDPLITKEELPKVMADEVQMVQLFQNLLSNALKFCINSPRIYISSSEEPMYHLFSVRDNGIGIDSQYFNRIFQIFQKLHPKEEYNGTGIGLAICKRIIDRHGGNIWVESVPNEGCTFYFTLKKNLHITANERFSH